MYDIICLTIISKPDKLATAATVPSIAVTNVTVPTIIKPMGKNVTFVPSMTFSFPSLASKKTPSASSAAPTS